MKFNLSVIIFLLKNRMQPVWLAGPFPRFRKSRAHSCNFYRSFPRFLIYKPCRFRFLKVFSDRVFNPLLNLIFFCNNNIFHSTQISNSQLQCINNTPFKMIKRRLIFYIPKIMQIFYRPVIRRRPGDFTQRHDLFAEYLQRHFKILSAPVHDKRCKR
jgi:hypothetical protein